MRLGAPIDDVRGVVQDFDAVVVAVGGRWERPDVVGAEAPWVHTVDELDGWLLRDEPLEGRHVVVLGVAHPCTVCDKWRQVRILDDDDTVVQTIGTWF